MFITSLIPVQISTLIHNFYNTIVAKKVTPFLLPHILSTTYPQSNIFTSTAVIFNWAKPSFHTHSTAPTTTIFNKIVINTNTSN